MVLSRVEERTGLPLWHLFGLPVQCPGTNARWGLEAAGLPLSLKPPLAGRLVFSAGPGAGRAGLGSAPAQISELLRPRFRVAPIV